MINSVFIQARASKVKSLFIIFSVGIISVIILMILGLPNSSEQKITYLLVFFLGFTIFSSLMYKLLTHTYNFAEIGMWFSFYYFAQFGIRAIVDIKTGFATPHFMGMSFAEANRLINIALVIAILGYVAFRWGYNRRLGHVLANSIPNLPRQWNTNLIISVAIICFILGWLSRLKLMTVQAGSLAAWITLWKAGNLDSILRGELGVEYFRQIGYLAQWGMILLLVAARIFRRQKYWFLFFLFTIPELLLWSLISGSRAMLPFIFLKILVVYYMTSERGHAISVKLLKWVAITAIILLISFPIITEFRFKGTSVIKEGISSSFAPIALLKNVGLRFVGLDALSIIVKKVPDEIPYTFGTDILYIPVKWIPRSFWPEKPVSLSFVFGKKFVPQYYEKGIITTVSLIGEFYWAFGVIGVILGMMFFGVSLRSLNEYLVRPKNNLSNILIVSSLFNVFIVAVENNISGLFTLHLFNFLMLILIALILGKRGREN